MCVVFVCGVCVVFFWGVFFASGKCSRYSHVVQVGVLLEGPGLNGVQVTVGDGSERGGVRLGGVGGGGGGGGGGWR